MQAGMYALLAILLGLGVLILAARPIFYLVAERVALVTKGPRPGTPLDAGLPYEELIIQSGRRRLQAWWIPASPSNDSRKALLVYHGNAETVPEWIPALRHLWEHGISTFIFDYSGFGRSTGRATFRSLHADALVASDLFAAKAGDRGKYLLGFSLGSGVLLDAQAGVTPRARGLILVAPFSSIGDVAMAWKMVPPRLTYLAPDIYDNVHNVELFRLPVLIVHSTDDQLFPTSMAEKLFAAANEPKNLVLLHGLKHNDMLEGRHAEYLAPVIEYLRATNTRGAGSRS